MGTPSVAGGANRATVLYNRPLQLVKNQPGEQFGKKVGRFLRHRFPLLTYPGDLLEGGRVEKKSRLAVTLHHEA